MPTVTESIVIARPREEVWDFCQDVANTPRWNPMFVHQELVGADAITPGARIHSIARILGKEIESVAEVTEVVAPRLSVLTSQHPIAINGSYIFDEVPGGTRFTWHLEAEAGLGGLFGTLADAIVIRTCQAQLRRALRELARLLEGDRQLADLT